MTLEHISKYRQVLVVVLGVLVIIGLGFLKTQSQITNILVQSYPGVSQSGPATLTGEYICLPHRDTSGPVTMECALGIQIDDGGIYALDTSAIMGDGQMPQFATGSKISVQGVLSTDDSVSHDLWLKYNIMGIMQADKITVY